MTVADRPVAANGCVPPEDWPALALLTVHGDHSSGFLTFNREMRHFRSAGCEGLVAYRPMGRRHLVQLCGPISAPEHREAVLDEFLEWAAAQRRRVAAVQLRPVDAGLYARRGFSVNQLGCSYSIDLERFSLRGTRFMKVRNKIARARRLGVTVEEVPDGDSAPELDAIDADWLRGKGRHANELEFLIGERGGRGASQRRIFLARLDGRPLAYVTYSPVFGSEAPGWLYDLTRRTRDAPPGIIELLFVSALERVRDEGVRWLHLGLTPFVGLDGRHRVASAESRVVSAFLHQLAERGRLLYSARTQEAAKLKWAPHRIEPEYVAFQRGPSLSAVVGLMRLTRSLPF
ncbi:MAG: DUF2156 domain-containing protein [Actinomycetota bacterium]|nr:DUF2156 domain-containing protein [Actinomycetota bacterium]